MENCNNCLNKLQLNTLHKKLWDADKEVLWGKVIALYA